MTVKPPHPDVCFGFLLCTLGLAAAADFLEAKGRLIVSEWEWPCAGFLLRLLWQFVF